jgi:hypothetical protein
MVVLRTSSTSRGFVTTATREGTLAILRKLQLLYLFYLSKPAANRPLYQVIYRHRAQKIVELSVGDGRRARQMIEVAQRRAVLPTDVHYVGLDLFEGRSESSLPGGSLKEVHQLLRGTGARVQLVPGNPPDALIRLANSLGKIDVLIVPAELDSLSFARLWFFVPRMLHEQSRVFVQRIRNKAETVLTMKPREEIDRLAAAGAGRRAA